MLAVLGHGFFAGENLLDDLDVGAGAREGFGEGLPVPAFDDLGAGDAEAEDDPALR